MRIVIDLQGAQTGSRMRGIGRYSMALAQAMARHRADHELILVLNGLFPETIAPIRYAFKDVLPHENIRVWHALGPVCTDAPGNTIRREVAEAIREDFIRSLNPDVLHITSMFEGFGDNAVQSIRKYGDACLVAVTFYDVIPLIQKQLYLDPNPHFKTPYYDKIDQLNRADLLLAISESSRQEAIQYLNFSDDRVVNISAAADAQFRPRTYPEEATRELKRRLQIDDRFLLYSGASDDRKNIRGLIEAYALLPVALRMQYQLVLAGGMPTEHLHILEDHVRSCGLDGSAVLFTGRVSDEELIHLYGVCDLYVFPSWHEGFGLPALEAMGCGAPVIGSNTTSVPEVIGLDRALFDPYSVRSIADKMLEVLTDDVFHAELKAHALVQAARFSWDTCARTCIRALEAAYQAAPTKVPLLKAHEKTLLQTVAQLVATPRADVDLPRLAQAMARNLPAIRPQLLVDVSELVQRDSGTGIQRVVRSVLREWLVNPPEKFDVRPVYATLERKGYRYATAFVETFLSNDKAARALTGASDWSVDFGMGDVFVALDMQHEVQAFQSATHQHMRAQGVDVRFVIYDLLPLTMPHCFPKDASANHAHWVSVAACSDGVMCISRAVAQDFRSWMEQQAIDVKARPRVDSFHLGSDIQNSRPTTGMPTDAEQTLEALRATHTFLMVGTLEPRKAHAQVLYAFEQLWQMGLDINLVIVGKQGWSVEPLVKRLRQHEQKGKHLFWFDGISDEYLTEIYAASRCLIAASHGEGFGLPLIEAAQHGIPIVCRDIPVFREVAGDAAYYFEGAEPDALADAIESWLRLHEADKHPKPEGVSRLTWRESAEQLLRCIEVAP
jgi:glycosyltransferase involved in cell wall biosynthesis